jgi:hypothetical protein
MHLQSDLVVSDFRSPDRGCILSRGLCDISTQDTWEEESRAIFEASDAIWKSVLYLVWNLSGATLTAKYFKL